MSFLQPLLLAALPLIALPVVIHLINQRRYQTMRWAAMMFLLAANRMSRGYAKLRQWLILLCRMAVVAGLVLAVSRPMAGGWVGSAAGGKADTTIVLLDRSPSMQQTEVGATATKLETAVGQLASTLPTLSSLRWVLIDSVSCNPTEFDSPTALLNSPAVVRASSSADLPAMLQAAYDYIKSNRVGRTEIWICSDLRANDWNAQSGRWESLRQAFVELKQGVRFHLLAYPQSANGNVAVRITNVRRAATSDAAELLVSLHLSRTGGNSDRITVPLHFEIDGARSELSIEMTGFEYDLKDHSIPLSKDHKRGWGRVSIPADVNVADNDFYFAYNEPPPRQTVIVADDAQTTRALEIAARIGDDPANPSRVDIVPVADLAKCEWEKTALLIWQSQLPKDDDAETVKAFIARGGQVVFFPPASPGDTEFDGVHWEAWETPAEEIAVENWRGDQDLLAHTQSGAGLPVGDLHVQRYCKAVGESTPLATLHGGVPLISRVNTDHGGVYFFGTTASPGDSSLATDGVVMFVAIQRALAAGAEVLGNTRQVVAGEMAASAARPWKQLTGPSDAVSTEYPSIGGVYTVGEQTVAVNRSAAEDQSLVVPDATVAELFRGLDFLRINGELGSVESLTHEIWRVFLVAMMTAMIFEAVLCLPKKRSSAPVVKSNKTI